MEQQNHELLGLIVAEQRKICEKLLADIKKREAQLTRKHAAFTNTCIPQVWDSLLAMELELPHYEDSYAPLMIPIRRYGRYLRTNDLITGLKLHGHNGITAEWRVRCDKSGNIKYWADMVKDKNGNYVGAATLTAQEFEKTFLAHVARIIPADKLQNIEPVSNENKKSRRRVVALAD